MFLKSEPDEHLGHVPLPQLVGLLPRGRIGLQMQRLVGADEQEVRFRSDQRERISVRWPGTGSPLKPFSANTPETPFHSLDCGSAVSGKSLFTCLLTITPGPSAIKGKINAKKRVRRIVVAPDNSTILVCMRVQQWSVMLFAAACWAQVPAGQPRGVQPVIPDNIAVEANIPYDSHKETVIDILRPKEKSKEKRPGVLLIHGGGWTSGTKEDRVAYAAMKYLEKGFVVANVEYRLAKTAPRAGGRY